MTQTDRQAWWVVFVLTTIYAISYVDRQMLTLLVAPIRRDLGLSDTQIGLLTGFAFAGVYAVMGVALGRVADTRCRIGLIAAGLTVWSLATAASGLARNFWQLFACRVGVGVGEASLTPAAYSLFSDLFPPQKLGRAIAVYTLAQYAGIGLALLIGGYVVAWLAKLPPQTWPGLPTFYPWQLAMMSVGLAGLPALALLRTLREPARRGLDGAADTPSFADGLTHLTVNWRVYGPHFLGFSLAGLYAGALAAWVPEFFRRTYAWPIEQAGLTLALIIIFLGGPSTLFGGWLADTVRARGKYGAPIWMSGLCMLALWPLTTALPLMQNAWLSVALLCAVTIVLTLPTAAAPAALQVVTPNRMRGQISALYLLCTNLIGAGAGPLAVGLVTDYVFARDTALHLSLSLVGALACPLAALALFFGLGAFTAAAGDAHAAHASSQRVRHA